MNLQQLMSRVRKAADDYTMIEEGDRIAVGLSGGKDSLAMLTALAAMRRFYPKKYDVSAVTVSLGFDMDFTPLAAYCERIGVDLSIAKTDIGKIVFDIRAEETPCSLCSKMRKGALNTRALELGCNKTALGHNRDDVVETFFMSLIFEGRIHTFTPVTYLDRTGLSAIRPFIYVTEKEAISCAASLNLPVIKNACPADKNTKREEIKAYIKTQTGVYKDLQDKVFSSIKRSDLWKN
ncbi:MAG: tRNA 2-thiocytidine biosynthesis TtcA family protein [Clostridiales bacterium]|jgi:tRNA(Ile)-lysidine synthase TilS/MesJ|nr:tRNA 2-thiocytidine biosynthesis TtcA family protein [Clostridiales bacterium]